MNNFLFKLKEDLVKIIETLINNNIISSSIDKNSLSIDYISKSKKGDVSTNLFIILKNNLIDKNYNLTENINEEFKFLNYVKNIEIAKIGFINIFFKDEFIQKNLFQILIDKNSYGNNNNGNNKKINVEFVSANPTGPIHIAHVRGAIFGDVLSSILQSTGYMVTREYYINDSGSQIKHLGNSLYKRYQEFFDVNISISKDEYPGSYLIDLAKNIYNKDKDKWLNDNSIERKTYFESHAISNLMNLIIDDLKKININFDQFTYESKIIQSNIIEKVFTILKKKNLLYEGTLPKPKGEDLITWEPRKQLLFRSSNFLDDSDRALKKSNGDWTYFANDTAYHYNKYLRNFSKLINIWGSDHIGYISRMKSIIEVISNKINYLDIYVCQIVRLIKNGELLKMSKRDGNYVTLSEIYNQVGKDPIRYFMISTKSETPMDFDIDKVIQKNKENPVFYCQYAFARASSVINKTKFLKDFSNLNLVKEKFDYKYLSTYEKDIILKLISWPYLLNQASEYKQPHRIANYLEELSSCFHSFWNRGNDDESLRIIDTKNIEKTITKLIWIESFRVVLQKAFSIIGIEANEQM